MIIIDNDFSKISANHRRPLPTPPTPPPPSPQPMYLLVIPHPGIWFNCKVFHLNEHCTTISSPTSSHFHYSPPLPHPDSHSQTLPLHQTSTNPIPHLHYPTFNPKRLQHFHVQAHCLSTIPPWSKSHHPNPTPPHPTLATTHPDHNEEE